MTAKAQKTNEPYYCIFIQSGKMPELHVMPDEQFIYSNHLLNKLVDGYIETTYISGSHSIVSPNADDTDMVMVVNEEGKIEGKSLNPVADFLHRNPYDQIVGNVVICAVRRFPIHGEEDDYEQDLCGWVKADAEAVLDQITCAWCKVLKEVAGD